MDFNQCSPNLESLFIQVTNKNEPTFVGVIYIPPSADKDSSISEVNKLLQKLPNSNFYITGDLNINLLKNNLDEYASTIF